MSIMDQFESQGKKTLKAVLTKGGAGQVLGEEFAHAFIMTCIRIDKRRMTRLQVTYAQMRAAYLYYDICFSEGRAPAVIAPAEKAAKGAHRSFERALTAYFGQPVKAGRPEVLKHFFDEDALRNGAWDEFQTYFTR